jgi:ActR/RegA family two-component response regulator
MKTEPAILVIDDESVVCESFTRILKNKGYKVDTKTRPREGLELALSRDYDLVFLDLKMEEMNGIDLFHNLREKNPDVPVVIVTGYPSMDTAIESIKLSVSDYILKPFTPERILKSVQRIIPGTDVLSKEAKPEFPKILDIKEWEPIDKTFRFYGIAWQQQGKDGSVLSGGQIPGYIARGIKDVVLPEINTMVYSGLPLAGVILSDESKFAIPSPMSGRVIDVNYELAVKPSVLEQNKFDECWIARIYPTDPEKDLQATQTRNVVLLSKSEDEVKPYLTRLVDLGCMNICVNTVNMAVDALIKNKNKVVILDAVSLSDAGPEYVHQINQQIPEAKIVVIDKPDSKFEEAYRENKILYYCIDLLFDEEITDILANVFTSISADEVLESHQPSVLPQSISKVHITNKHGKKVTLLVFGDLLFNNKGIGYVLINKLIEEAYPLEVNRGTNYSYLYDPVGQKEVANEKEKNDLIITFQAKDTFKIPGQIHKEIGEYTNSKGTNNRIINLFIQPNKVGENEQLLFNNVTSKGVAELLFNKMTSL